MSEPLHPAGHPVVPQLMPFAVPVVVADAVDHHAAATAAGRRSLAPDLARGVMLLLIALANVPWWLYQAPHALTNGHSLDQTGGDFVYQLFSLVAIDGRAYPLFAFLFGYGMWQSYARQAAAGASWRTARRMLQMRHLWMLAFGLVHGVMLWMGDIVGSYGLVGLLVAWLLLRRSDRVLRIVAWIFAGLIALGAAFMLVGAIAVHMLDEIIEQIPPDAVRQPASADTYLLFLWENWQSWPALFFGQALTLTVPLSVLLGILAARRGLLDRPSEHKQLLRRIALGGVLIGWAGGAVAAMQFGGLLLVREASFGTMGISGLTGIAGGIGYAAIFALIALAIGERRGFVAGALTAVGKRSLSSYLLQSVLFAPLLAAWGFGLGGVLSPLGAAALAVGVWLVTVVVAVLLERLGKRGPAEALLRKLSYGKRRVAAPTPVA